MTARGWLLVGIGALAGAGFALALHGEAADAQAPQPAPRPAVSAPPPIATPPAAPVAQPPRAAPASAGQLMLSYAPIVRQTAPAVVNVFTRKTVRRSPMMDDPFFRFFFNERGGQGRERVEQSLGSGVIVQANGLVVTNNHVIDGADEITVVLADRREFPATLVLADQRTDLAVLRINPGGKALPTVRLGDSDRVQVGDIVLAIGNPFGVGQTTTHGIVSAVARSGLGINDFDFFIQTDAAINRGNSGGALVDMTGSLIGINTAIFSPSGGSNGIGFAVPVNMVRTVVNTAAQGGRQVVRPWLGIAGQQVTADDAKNLRLERPVGVLVQRVTAGSPSARAGIRAGDVIFAIDGREVSNVEGLSARAATKGVGASAVFTIIRAGAAQNIPVALVAAPELPARSLTVLPNGSLFAGVQIGNLSPAFAQELGVNVERGVIVTALAPGAPVARVGVVQPGDILETINGREMLSVDQVRQSVAQSAQGMTFSVNRQGRRFQCGFRPPAQLNCR
jgi:Do/DeqQ family serine protease